MKKIAISAFIIINFLMMIRAQVNDKTPYSKVIFAPATYIQDYFSIYRGWEMFAPNPLRTNGYVDAKVEYRDGTFKVIGFPVQESHIARYFRAGERYRKFSEEGIRKDKNQHLWPDAARWFLKRAGEIDPSKIPSRVHLRRHWQDIPSMEESFVGHREKINTPWKMYQYYTYEVL